MNSRYGESHHRTQNSAAEQQQQQQPPAAVCIPRKAPRRASMGQAWMVMSTQSGSGGSKLAGEDLRVEEQLGAEEGARSQRPSCTSEIGGQRERERERERERRGKDKRKSAIEKRPHKKHETNYKQQRQTRKHTRGRETKEAAAATTTASSIAKANTKQSKAKQRQASQAAPGLSPG